MTPGPTSATARTRRSTTSTPTSRTRSCRSESTLSLVPSCQPGNENNEYGPAIPAFSAVPSGRQVCVDQNSFVRDSAGNLSATLYYYDDLKGTMG